MTEGGGATMLAAHQFPNKLHTVGRPMPGNEIRLFCEDGREVAVGEVGKVVGRSDMMMTEYHNLPEKTLEAEWRDAQGRRFIRTGDIGRFDEDGFLIYSSDIAAELARYEVVVGVAVISAPQERWD
jgi:acyl-CoA synthetase (AMP-forming)/AMP-acid ligase II